MNRSNDRRRRFRGVRSLLFGRGGVVIGAVALLALVVASAAGAWTGGGSGSGMQSHSHHGNGTSGKPLRAVVITPQAGDKTASGFNINVSLQAKNRRGNNLLSGYSTQFLDPTGPDGKGNPAFHPGASAVAPGLVVTLSTTPNKGPGTPLQGPATNLAGVFQINSVTKSHGLRSTWNDWQVTSPGFFGKNTPATLTVYAVRGKAPDVIPAGGLQPISNVVHETFNIGS